jgi:hypothetical protein
MDPVMPPAIDGDGVPPRITTGFDVMASDVAEIGRIPAADAASSAFAAPTDSGAANAKVFVDVSRERNADKDKNQFSSPAMDASVSDFFPR